MERNLCHLLIPAYQFRTCSSQDRGAYPVSKHTEKASAGRAYLQQIRRAVLTHALCTAGCTRHEAAGSSASAEDEGRCAELFHSCFPRCSFTSRAGPQNLKMRSASVRNSLFQLSGEVLKWKLLTLLCLAWCNDSGLQTPKLWPRSKHNATFWA